MYVANKPLQLFAVAQLEEPDDFRMLFVGLAQQAVQLVGARPRVSARAVEARAALSAAAGADVSFSATTTDHLGFLGREEGLLAVATALVRPVGE